MREHPEEVRHALEVRNIDTVDLDRILEIDRKWRELKSEGDNLRKKRNELTDQVAHFKAEGDEQEAQDLIEQSQELKQRIENIEAEASDLESTLEQKLLRLPLPPRKSVTVGDDEDDNVELERYGFETLRDLPGEVVPHYDIGEDLEILDFERGAKVTGGGFFFLKGDGARLEHALIQFMLDIHRDQGYIDVQPPIPVNSRSMTGTGQLPKFSEDAYRVGRKQDEPYTDDDLWLCPTAEVPVTNMYRDEILLPEDLPIKYQAYTPNFRREAGEHGTETRGMVRVHQFDKVELVNLVQPQNSYERFEDLLEEAEAVLDQLELPYRRLELCTGDMSDKAAKQIDLEVWAPANDMPDGPSQGGRWLEVSTASNFEAFQSRRADLRYRPAHHKDAEYLHTLNASGLALPRVFVSILEYYQNPDGTITIPEALRPYMDGQELIEGHESVGESALGSNGSVESL